MTDVYMPAGYMIIKSIQFTHVCSIYSTYAWADVTDRHDL